MNQYVKKIFIILIIIFSFWLASDQDRSKLSVKGIDEENSLKLYFLDVGQGDATLIQTPNGKDILIDGGPNNIIVQKLGEYMSFTNRDIELMILTHPHSDHVTGLVEILERYEIDKILMTGVLHTAPDYLAFLELIKKNNIEVEIIDSPREINIDDVIFQMIYPNESFLNQRVEELNNTSLAFKMVYASTSVMFTGDLEIEEELLIQSMVQLKSDIYQAGHHGSINANDRGFVEAVAPKYVIISAGADNKFGHPHYRTLNNFERIKAEIFRTDREGDVVFLSDGIIFYTP